MKTATVERTPLEWCQRGNDICEKIGRRDVHWVLRQGRPTIEWKCQPEQRSSADEADRRSTGAAA